MGVLKRIGDAVRGTAAQIQPSARFFSPDRDRSLLLSSWRPALREPTHDVQESWEKAAARGVEAVQNSGFLTKVVEVETGNVVGAGLRFASRPDADALGWTQEQASQWARKAERSFRAWAENPMECDAAGKMTFAKMQQAAFASYKCYGEVLALLPMIRRPGSTSLGKVMLLPPSRLSQQSDGARLVQGVRVDGNGLPVSYVIRKKGTILDWDETEIRARDNDGRPNVVHVFDAAMSVTRGISPLTPVLKVIRQAEQYADATLVSALIQTIFAATLETNITGLAGFDGLMTGGDTGVLKLPDFLGAKKEWYDGANIDLTQHGRIAQLFPNEKLTFTEAKQPGQQYDQFMGWLMREIAAGAGVTYENATGDYRGATYSSIRMAGATEWLTVIRRRKNIIEPFCNMVKDAYFDEAIGSGRLEFPGGYDKFRRLRSAATRGTWSGPAQPQADDFKAARSWEVLKGIGGTTMAEIGDAYGQDWDDRMRQQAEENRLATELGLPLPWAPTDMIQTPEGQELALQAPTDTGTEKKEQSRKRNGTRDPSERDPANAKADVAEAEAAAGMNLDAELEAELLADEKKD